MAQTGEGNKVLVAYFSRIGEQHGVNNIQEGNTAIVAKMIAEKTGADLFEIKPLNDTYPNGYIQLTQAAKAEKQANARPEICGKVENIEDYDVVFLGYPNWWGDMPMPVYTFVDNHDLSAKKFTTSVLTKVAAELNVMVLRFSDILPKMIEQRRINKLVIG